jgi:hypothetical protein
MGYFLLRELVNELFLDHAEDVFLAHHHKFLAFDLDYGAGLFAEEHLVAD